MNDMEILASIRALRVIGIMGEHGELTITDLVRRAGTDHQKGDEIVRQLAEHGMLQDIYRGRNRLIRSLFRSYEIAFIKGQGLVTQLTPTEY